jgi:hypothetical protein
MADTPVIEKFLQAIEGAMIPGCDAWDPDATLDATVPGWRLHAGRWPCACWVRWSSSAGRRRSAATTRSSHGGKPEPKPPPPC